MKITPEDKLDKTQSRLKDLRRQLQEESEAQQKIEEREKQVEESKYQDNNFWKVASSLEGVLSDAQLLADLDN
jgi:DNA-binding transcriptional regulator GbsR (MarR family)